MTTGEGIFYGLLFLGFILLYVVTRDRWSWKRIAKWFFAALLIVLLGIAVVAGAYHYLDSRPKFQSEFWGISPGMSEAEVIFRKGKPDHIEDKETFHYSASGRNLSYAVRLKNGKARFIAAYTSTDRLYELPSLQGISNHSTLKDIEKKFGKPSHVSNNKDNTLRIVNFLDYGVFFTLEKDAVVNLGVLDPKEGPMRFANE